MSQTKASLALWNSLAEDIFFFQYNYRMSKTECMNLPINLRRWMVQRFIDQKQKEEEAMEKARKKSSKS